MVRRSDEYLLRHGARPAAALRSALLRARTKTPLTAASAATYSPTHPPFQGANHYGLPDYPLAAGYRRLYGPWLQHVSTGTSADDSIAAALATARTAIVASWAGLPSVVHPLYAPLRSTVVGSVRVTDGRPGSALWVMLSTQAADVVYDIHENTYFVLTDAAGNFSLPGIPPGVYNLYVFAAGGSITDVLRRGGVNVTAAPTTQLGVVSWTPSDAGATFLWQIGGVDRTGGEFALARAPREWDLPGKIPGSLTFTIGTSREGTDWYYAQTQRGTWTVAFTLPQTYTGTGSLVVSASLTQGSSPSVSINGVTPTGSMPAGSDSTLSRQAIRSGYARLATLSFDAAILRAGTNTLTFTRGAAAGGSNNTGMGYDSVIMLVHPAGPPVHAAPQLGVAVARTAVSPGDARSTWRITVSNSGGSPAMLPRLDAFEFVASDGGSTATALRPSFVEGDDPHIFPLPVAPYVVAGGTATLDVTLNALPAAVAGAASLGVRVRVSTDGGRSHFDSIVEAALGVRA